MVAANTFIIGAPKCGTTKIWRSLMDLPDVCVSQPKEPDFFSVDENYYKQLYWYHRHFKHYSGESIVVDCSTTYGSTLRFQDTAARIREYCRSAKIVYIIRNPYNRMESDWKQLVTSGISVPREFNAAVLREPSILLNSCYWSNILPYLQHFGKGQVRCYIYEKLFSDQDVSYDFQDFIGLPYSAEFFSDRMRINQSHGKTMRRQWAETLEGYNVVRVLKKYVPERMRRVVLRPLTRQKVPREISWDPDVLAMAEEKLANEMWQISLYFGIDIDLLQPLRQAQVK